MCGDEDTSDQAGEPAVLAEVMNSLRLAHKYRGSAFGDDELEYVASLLGETLPYKPRKPPFGFY